jgi:hypothetical protein
MLSALIWAVIGLILGAAITRSVLRTIGITLVAGLIGYFCMPMLNPQFHGFWFTLLFLTALSTAWDYWSDNRYYSPSAMKTGCAIGIGAATIWLGLSFASSGVFHSATYHQMIGEVRKDATYDHTLSPVDIKHVRTVYSEQARIIGEKRLGEDPGLGSRAHLDTMTLQSVNGELVWVGALEHSFFTRQWANPSTPGYIKVTATGVGEVTYVHNAQATAAMPCTEIVYAPGHYFGYDLERHLRSNGYLLAGLADFTFEIDDSGKPYWTATKFEKKVWLGGSNATALILVDATTGQIQEYSLDKVPAWVDRVQPADFVIAQLNDWGQYEKGWLNSWVGKQGVVKTTPGLSNSEGTITHEGIELVYGRDGQAYWYTGIQSAAADGGTTGFVLVNARTKATTWYPYTGWTEAAVAKTTENAPGVKEMRYEATYPIHYNVNGVPSYFNSLVGSDKLPKMYAFASVTAPDREVGVGATPAEALKAYQAALRRNPNANVTDQASRQSETLVVQEVAQEVTRGETFYYLRLQGKDGVEFVAEAGLNGKLKWLKAGNTVEVKYTQAEGNPVIQLDALNVK